MKSYFDFENLIEELDNKIKFLEQDEKKDIKIIEDYQEKKLKLFEKIYTKLTPWQKVQIARHPNRPHTVDYIRNIFNNVI